MINNKIMVELPLVDLLHLSKLIGIYEQALRDIKTNSNASQTVHCIAGIALEQDADVEDTKEIRREFH